MKNIKIGSDPEFVISEDGEFIDADEVFWEARNEKCSKEYREKNCGTTRCNHDNKFCGTGEESPQIGDDCGLGELRPNAGKTPLEHKDNIQELFTHIKMPEGYKLYAGTIQLKQCLGGHIHVGMYPINYRIDLIAAHDQAVEKNRQLAQYLFLLLRHPTEKD